MRKRAVFILAGIGAFVTLFAVLQYTTPAGNGGVFGPPISDSSEVSDNTRLDIGASAGKDKPIIQDNADATPKDLDNDTKEGVNYYVDKQGNKHYTLKAQDKPALKP